MSAQLKALKIIPFGPVCKVTPEGCERSADCKLFGICGYEDSKCVIFERDVPIPFCSVNGECGSMEHLVHPHQKVVVNLKIVRRKVLWIQWPFVLSHQNIAFARRNVRISEFCALTDTNVWQMPNTATEQVS